MGEGGEADETGGAGEGVLERGAVGEMEGEGVLRGAVGEEGEAEGVVP